MARRVLRQNGGKLTEMRREQRLFLAWREHRLLHAINQVVFELDDRGCWTFLNRAWTGLSGRTAAETIGSHFCEALHAEDVETGEALLDRVRAGEAAQALVRLQMADGASRWVNVEIAPSPPLNGGLPTMAGSLTEAKARQTPEIAGDRSVREQTRHPDPAQEERMGPDQGQGPEPAQTDQDARMSFTLRAARELASGKPLDALYDWFVHELNETFGFQQTRLYTCGRERASALPVAASGKRGRLVDGGSRRIAAGEGIVGRVIDTATTVIEDMKEVPEDLWDEGTSDGARSRGAKRFARGREHYEMGLPILMGETLLGVLAISTAGEMAPEQDAVAWLEGLAGLLASAIESAQLRQQMEERMAELDNLQRLMRREAWLRTPQTRNKGVRGYRFDGGRMGTLGDEPTADPAHPSPAEGKGQGGAERIVRENPLQVRGQKFGTLGVEDDAENPLTEEDLALLEAVSTQVSEAMENARLLEQTQKRAVELETVSRVSTATSTILEKDKLLRGVVELTKRSFNLYHAHIYLLDAERGDLVLTAGSGDAGQQMVEDGWHIALDEARSIVAQVARTRKGIIVDDVRKETGFLPNPLLPRTRSELAVPLISGNRLLGVLDVQSDRVAAFTEDDVRIQSALAGQVATALQNATLYQEQLETAEKLREFDRLKSEFLASMSHELRTPLNSVIGFADVLLEGIDGELNERMREDVQLIRNSGQHLRELIGDILDMSKIEAGMMDLRYQAVEVEALRQEIEGFARTQLIVYDKSLDFEMRVGREVSTVEADLTRFKQILFNLVSNAIKFTLKGSVLLSMTVEGDDLLVQVQDTGIGISDDDVSIVFEQFRQVDGSLTRTAGGTGLGLPISKSLVELHGGEIWVESVPGEGTTFSFTIPLSRQWARGKARVEKAAPARETDGEEKARR